MVPRWVIPLNAIIFSLCHRPRGVKQFCERNELRTAQVESSPFETNYDLLQLLTFNTLDSFILLLKFHFLLRQSNGCRYKSELHDYRNNGESCKKVDRRRRKDISSGMIERNGEGVRFFAYKRESEHRYRSDLERISDKEHYEFLGKKKRNRVGGRVTPLE